MSGFAPAAANATHSPHKLADAAPVTLQMSQQTAESTYFIARILMDFCHWIMKIVGQPYNSTLFVVLYTCVVFLFAMAVGIILQWIVVFVLHKLRPHIKSTLYGELINRKFFTKACRIIPPLIFLILIQFTLYMHNSLLSWLTRLSFVYIVIEVSIALCTLSDVIWVTIDSRENTRKLPLHGIVQVVKLIIWVIATIIIAALLLDKSPAALLAGIGAFAAVLMLVFKDSILGIVAGVQLAQDDSLHVGDWISLPNGHANGTVSEVTLTEVKVLNWDKTISTVPPYTLITAGFKNYRNMQESHTREISRSYLIDADSVVETTDKMLDAFAAIPLMKEWIEKKRQQRAEGHEYAVNNPAGLVDGTIDTNLGVFRAYLKLWLDANLDISHTDDCFVATQAQTPTGIPLWIYCFTATSAWAAYEAIMSGVFEHLASMLHKFDLYTFENPSGRDTIIEGYLSPGKPTEPLFGLPYPIFIGAGTPMCPGVSKPWETATPAPQPNPDAQVSQQNRSAPKTQASDPVTQINPSGETTQTKTANPTPGTKPDINAVK